MQGLDWVWIGLRAKVLLHMNNIVMNLMFWKMDYDVSCSEKRYTKYGSQHFVIHSRSIFSNSHEKYKYFNFFSYLCFFLPPMRRIGLGQYSLELLFSIGGRPFVKSWRRRWLRVAKMS